ncbi:MAG: YbaB/EbfC family nucleoid-associated protein [Solirubrobacteraceae bacterium]
MSKRSTRPMPGARKGGAPGRQKQQGGMPNVQQMMAQVQQMQQDMEAAQEQLKHETVSASAGGGMVTVEVTGDLRVRAVTIDPEAVDPQDVDMLADMVTAAVNEGLRAAQELASSKLGGATGELDLGDLGGLGPLPPGLGLPGL